MDMTRGIFYKFKENDYYENKIINIDDFIEEIDSSYSTLSNSTNSGSENDNGNTDNYNNQNHYNYDNQNHYNYEELYTLLELDYSTNYNVKNLSQIMDYYGVSKKNMRKDEMIQIIILFESDPINSKIVERRRNLWDYINELKKDAYFSKFIIW